jgi:hypothetical protein
LIAAENVEGRGVVADIEANMAAALALEDEPDKAGEPFSVEAAIRYLERLDAARLGALPTPLPCSSTVQHLHRSFPHKHQPGN